MDFPEAGALESMVRAVVVAGFRGLKVLAAVAAALLAVTAVSAAVLAWAIAGTGDPRLYPPAPGAATVEVAVVDHGYHAGLVVRTADVARAGSERGLPALSALAARFGAYPWLEIGWGDSAFYRFAPRLSDVTVGMAMAALSGSNDGSVLHVVGLMGGPAASFPAADAQTLRLSEVGFDALAVRLAAAFAPDAAGQPEALGPGLYGQSLFFSANGRYSLFATCNHWVADLFAAAGLRVSPVPAVLSNGLLADLRWRNEL
ncbi:DUF2459 domain-containing protein [Pseudoxanthobacter sp. M-2]|uniref:DUF2459 domain-containing protein n=1 Tax=Pseudoxanthobacter sp. M-2 TaxID=3078754 RepID=UPI0038FCB297